MKEIKFRAWDKEKKIFYYFTLFDVWRNRKYPYLLYIKELPIDQYTGLKDKNDKKIYERDIIKSTLNETKIGIMELKKGRFQISFKNRSMLFCHENRKSLEALGNIYENPELLEEK